MKSNSFFRIYNRKPGTVEQKILYAASAVDAVYIINARR